MLGAKLHQFFNLLLETPGLPNRTYKFLEKVFGIYLSTDKDFEECLNKFCVIGISTISGKAKEHLLYKSNKFGTKSMLLSDQQSMKRMRIYSSDENLKLNSLIWKIDNFREIQFIQNFDVKKLCDEGAIKEKNKLEAIAELKEKENKKPINQYSLISSKIGNYINKGIKIEPRSLSIAKEPKTRKNNFDLDSNIAPIKVNQVFIGSSQMDNRIEPKVPPFIEALLKKKNKKKQKSVSVSKV